MAVFKCKMCGGALEINNETVIMCDYCGTQQTLPRLDDDRRANLYDRANHFRRNNEFDKAMGIYEKILTEDTTDAESYWSLVLCRYGIEYVEDPSSHKRIPTVNRAQFTSVFDDEDYKSALQYADAVQKSVYEEESRAINEIQKGILAISQKEEPFDVFICYKETDNNGRRTPDSVIATELYHELTREGFKVFFSRITLEDKLGTAYEPYIFAALNSAKVMVVLGTKPEYFNAVWVKNEWSRYLSLIKNGAKKMLIPAYKDMDPYDLPEEFSHLQAQDMSKLGFMQDLIRGIKKIAEADAPKETVVKQTVVQATGNTNTAPLLKRAFMFLEDGDWNSANEYCEKVLDIDPECAEAYLGKLMAELRCRKQGDLKNCKDPFDGMNNYQKVLRFGDEKLKTTLAGYIDFIKDRNENARKDEIYSRAKNMFDSAKTEKECKAAAELFKSIRGYKDAAKFADNYDSIFKEKLETERKDLLLLKAKAKQGIRSVVSVKAAIEIYQSIPGWKDADEQLAFCQKELIAIEAEEADRFAEEKRKAELIRQQQEAQKRKIKKIASIAGPIVAVIVAIAVLIPTVIIPTSNYNKAVKLMKNGSYTEAIAAFEAMDGYKDSAEKIDECNTSILDEKYNAAIALQDAGKYEEAIMAFESLAGYKDSADRINACNAVIIEAKYNAAIDLMKAEQYTEAIAAFDAIAGYKDSAEKNSECKYFYAEQLLANGEKAKAAMTFYNSQNYADAKERSFALWNEIVKNNTFRTIAAGGGFTVGLKNNGTVIAIGNNINGAINVNDWTNIVAVDAGLLHTVGLKSDGTVVATNFTGPSGNYSGQCNVSSWTDIVAVEAGWHHTVGQKSDGTLVAVGSNYYGQCNISDWTDIVAFSVGTDHTVGLKADGTVVAVGRNKEKQCNVSEWTDIVAISAGVEHTVGLKSDGTVVAVGDGYVPKWTDIVAIDANSSSGLTIGLKSDGTVASFGDSGNGATAVYEWTDIVAIAAGSGFNVGLKSDGTVVAVGSNEYGQCDVSSWTNIKLPE